MWYAKVWDDLIEVSTNMNDIDGEMIDFLMGSKAACLTRAIRWTRRLDLDLFGTPNISAPEFLWRSPYRSTIY